MQSTNPEFNKAVVRVNIFREHRQTIQVNVMGTQGDTRDTGRHKRHREHKETQGT